MGGTQAMRVPTNEYPRVFNILLDPREEYDTGPSESWIVGKYLAYVIQYYRSVAQYPNPPRATIVDFSERR